MKRLLLILVAPMLFLASARAQQLDSAVNASLDVKLKEYFEAIRFESLETQKQECDFLISTCTDSLVRQAVALKILDYYSDSKVMGVEGIAVYLIDKWFLTGEISMRSEIDYLNAKIFADFNRQSLLGERARELRLATMSADSLSVFSPEERIRSYRIVYFYDTDCVKCKAETILLRNIMDSGKYPVTLYAIYTGDDRDRWNEYVSLQFDFESDAVNVVHLSDFELNSDYQRKYGVLQTPMMFLVNPQGVIVGRHLDSHALMIMLEDIFKEVEMEYGSEESESMFDGLLAGLAAEGDGGELTYGNLREVADYIAARTLHQGDTLMFKQLSGDYLYYLAPKSGERFKQGLEYLIDEYIVSRGDVWRTADDSLKIIGLAEFSQELMSKAEVGTRIADLKVPGQLMKDGDSCEGEFRLRKLKGKRNIIIFYTEGCGVCDAEKKAAAALLASAEEKIKVLTINVDEVLSGSGSLSASLFDSFDLSTLPMILETDRKGIITRRYISLIGK